MGILNVYGYTDNRSRPAREAAGGTPEPAVQLLLDSEGFRGLVLTSKDAREAIKSMKAALRSIKAGEGFHDELEVQNT